MTRTILASIMLALTTGGFAAAGTGLEVGPPGGAPTYAGDAEEKKVTVGNAGETASLAVDEVTLTPESNVEVSDEKTNLGQMKGGMSLN